MTLSTLPMEIHIISMPMEMVKDPLWKASCPVVYQMAIQGFDTDCNDSAEDLDGDGEADGADFNNLDEDNDGLTTCGEDTDGDGVIDSRDCADGTAAVGARDNDGDGFISCIDDCNDNDAFTFPGAGFNEADPTACMTDADGDGWGEMNPDSWFCRSGYRL